MESMCLEVKMFHHFLFRVYWKKKTLNEQLKTPYIFILDNVVSTSRNAVANTFQGPKDFPSSGLELGLLEFLYGL